MSGIKLSVVIPTRNRRHLIARTLPTVLNQDCGPGDYEVVVVSDGCTDGTAEFVRNIKTPVPLHLLERPHRGIAATQNAGIEQARGELVMVLDDDLICEPTLMARHIEAHRVDVPCVAFGPRFFSPESRPGLATELLGDWYRDHARRLALEGGPRGRFDVWLDSNFSVPRKLLLDYGAYDETLKYSTEDRELGTRLWDAGVPFKFLPDAAVYEIYSKTAGEVVFCDAPAIGIDEIKFSRKAEGYRCISLPASLLGETRSKLMAWWMCCVPPLSPDLALRIPCSIAQRLAANDGMRSFGLRVLQYRKAIAVMRSAMREAGSWRALRREFGMRLPVLRYPEVPAADRFEAQVRWLARRGYTGITPSQWIAWVKTGQALPQRPVLFSFDGACAKSAQCALPVLLGYGFRAVVHITTGAIANNSAPDEPPAMTTDQIRYWLGKGIEFGAQARSYQHLTELDAGRLAEEVEGSAAELARVLERRPVSFTYPFGAVNDDMVKRVRGSFEMALGNAPGLNALCTDLHLMHTSAIGPSFGIVNLASTLLAGHSTFL